MGAISGELPVSELVEAELPELLRVKERVGKRVTALARSSSEKFALGAPSSCFNGVPSDCSKNFGSQIAPMAVQNAMVSTKDKTIFRENESIRPYLRVHGTPNPFRNLMPQQLSPQLDSILKETSRAFYLSLAILPAYSRRPLSLAYLLARAADTIADSEGSPAADRRETLLRYQTLLADSAQSVNLNLTAYQPEHEGEQALLSRVPDLFVELRQSEEHEQRAIVSVVKTLVDGMLWDQELFQENPDRSGLSMEQLETYTYLVAGCVGPFWSEVCAWGDRRLSPLLSDPMVEVAKEFGKGLQWVNILRDIPADQDEGRFYLPELSHPHFSERFLACSQRALEKGLPGR